MTCYITDHFGQLVGVALLAVLFYVGNHPSNASYRTLTNAEKASYTVLTNPISKVPGPWYTKCTDVVSRYKWVMGQRTEYIHDLHQKYGPVVRISPNWVAVADLDAVKEIYTIKETYRKTSFYKDLVGLPIQSIFSTDDVDLHRKLRRLLASQLSETSLKSLMPRITSLVELAVQRMKEEFDARGAIDVFKWSLFMATDIIGELSFGESFRMLDHGKKTQYIEDLENISSSSAYRVAFPTAYRLISRGAQMLPIFKASILWFQRMSKYAEQSLERYQSIIDTDSSKARETFFTRLFKAEEDEKIGFHDILINARSFIVAGSDTTANSLSYLLWSVCKRPALRDALVKELQTLPQNSTEQELRDLPLLNQTIKETLRLYSAVPASLPRAVPLGGAEIGGYQLNEGTTVSTQAYTLHRDPYVFENPYEFDPYRWANPSKAMVEAYMPFGRGPRICIGLHLAYIELRLATARFFQQFPNAHVSTREGMSDRDMDQVTYFIICPKGKRCLIEA